jgi:DNA repair exonuclease SbcCD ATPase subunit
MKIFSVNVQNYKSLKSFNLELDGKSLVVAGPTGSGKTTAISTLWDIIEKVGEPVTHGKRKGFISLTLQAGGKKIFARREFTEKTNTISILTSEGQKISAAEFKSWIHAQSVDPHKILDLGPQEQVKVLLSTAILPEGINLDELDRRKVELDKSWKGVSFRKKSFGIPEPVEPAEPVLIEELQGELENINADINTKNELAKDIAELNKTDANIAIRIAHLKAELLTFEKQLVVNGCAVRDLQSKYDAFPTRSQDDIKAKVATAMETNQKAKEYQDYINATKKIAGFDEELDLINVELNTINEVKRDALERAVWPMPGVSIRDDSIYLNGTLLENCGTSERMLVAAVLVGHAVAKSPVKIVRMDGIESMSQKDFSVMLGVFDKLGVQVLASKVVDEQSDSISIEESADVAFDVQLL